MSKSKILFIMTGSIACYKACNVISKLIQQGHEVQVVATASALKFVGNATIEGLTGKPAISDLFESGNVMDHIHLARWADLVIVAPATAHFMNKMSNGIADDLASTLFLAHDFTKPFLVAPAMNTMMYRHPTTQESLKKLIGMGIQVLDSASGILACGETGYGRLLEPEQILESIQAHLGQSTPTAKVEKAADRSKKLPFKILVTAGGTQESIDDVRVISNVSTGKTGYRIAHYLLEAGFDVELLQAKKAEIPNQTDIPVHYFTDYKSLDSEMKRLLSENAFTHVIHAAAVSDYSVEKYDGKINSSEALTLKLIPNPKLISKIKSYSKNPIKIVGFKLTSHLSTEQQIQKIENLMMTADYVVHNDLSEITKDRHKFTLWGLKKPRVYDNVEQLSVGLIQAISTEVKT